MLYFFGEVVSALEVVIALEKTGLPVDSNAWSRRTLLAGLAAALVVGVVACGGSEGGSLSNPIADQTSTGVSGVPDSASPPRKSVASPPSSEPNTDGHSSVVLSDKWSDFDGYTYEFTLNEPNSMRISADTVNSRPGEVTLEVEVLLEGTVTNTTPARNAPMPTDLYAGGIWGYQSPVCMSDAGFDRRIEGFCSIGQAVELYPADSSKIQIGRAAGLAPGESVQVISEWGRSNLVLKEADYTESLKNSLATPDAWIFGRPGRTEPQPLTSCLLVSGGNYLSVATVETDCHST
ncbi:hypothetical protein GQ649_27700 [Rhodococcus sp. DSM 6344]|jgi:hypothetical protein|nr:hypothetical protein [Rhodococcus erythropolis]